jgi:MerR family mercuric resistance operon transcriptional regulator
MPPVTISRAPALTIGALAKRTGVGIETIRFYERGGVLPKPPRSMGGHRLYGGEYPKRLNFVRRCRDLGFSLDDVRRLLRLVDGGGYTCAEVKTVAINHLADVRRKIADLTRLERTLAVVASKCTGGKVPDCPIMDAFFDET